MNHTLPFVLCVAFLLFLLTACASPELNPRQIAWATEDELLTTFRDHAGRRGAPVHDEYARSIRRKAMERYHADWPRETKELILTDHIARGMDSHMVLWAWGEPMTGHATTSPYGEEATWQWGEAGFPDFATVTFHDNRVTWWTKEGT